MIGVTTGTFNMRFSDTGAVLDLQFDTEKLRWPYFSQWDSNVLIDGVFCDADDVRGDCGPAVLCSLIHGLTEHTPTVNEVSLACGQPRVGDGVRYTTHAQLRQGARAYGLELATRSKYHSPVYDMGTIMSELDNGRASVALINYRVMRERMQDYPGWVQNQDTGYNGGHWVAVVEYGDGYVAILDPDFWGDRRNDGDYRRVPLDVFKAAIGTVSPGCTVGNQGLVITV